MDPVVAEEYIPSHCIRNENELHRPFGRGEVNSRHVRLYASRYEAHVFRWVDMLPWPLIAVDVHGVPSHTGSITITRMGCL
jgi:hypothetical protein